MKDIKIESNLDRLVDLADLRGEIKKIYNKYDQSILPLVPGEKVLKSLCGNLDYVFQRRENALEAGYQETFEDMEELITLCITLLGSKISGYDLDFLIINNSIDKINYKYTKFHLKQLDLMSGCLPFPFKRLYDRLFAREG